MLRRIDRSKRLSRFLKWISPVLAQRRGMPMLVGTAIVILSGLCFAVVIPALVISDEVSAALLWICLPLGLLYVGLFVGFLGFMLATPLGEAYRSSE
ncbi:MAG: hypothetical protein GYB66_16225 [Chloroflexi bacterium]|nr:hypothetical protein [Chloroflexota bacterium]